MTWYPSSSGPVDVVVVSRLNVNLKASSSCGVEMFVVKSVLIAGVAASMVMIELMFPSIVLVETKFETLTFKHFFFLDC